MIPSLAWFRDEIRKAYGGRAPKVLDPFAGGGAIPLEAMRLGCDVTAMDINPVAWFILKCTLEYPQKLAGQTRPLPEFALEDGEFMEAFLKAKGFKGASLRTFLERLGHGDGGDIQLDLLQQDDPILEADLAWHVRAWGRWVLAKARMELAAYYPTYAEFEPLKPDVEYEPRHRRLLEVDDEGVPQVDPLKRRVRRRLSQEPRRNPRWIAKTDGRLPLGANRDLQTVPRHAAAAQDALVVQEGSQARAADDGAEGRYRPALCSASETTCRTTAAMRRSGGSTTSASERAPCRAPAQPARAAARSRRWRIFVLKDRAGRLGAVMTAVVVDGPKGKGKEYRLPTDHERAGGGSDRGTASALYADIPFGLPEEQTPKAGIGASRAFSVDGYGFDTWRKLFTNRQLLAIGGFVLILRRLMQELDGWRRVGARRWLQILHSRMIAWQTTLAQVCSWSTAEER